MSAARAVIVGVLVVSFLVRVARAQAPPASEVHVFAADQAGVASLVALDLDLIPHEVEPGWVPIIVYGPDDLVALSQAGFQWQMVHPDLSALIASGLVPPSEGPGGFPNGSMGGYFTFDEMVAAFDALVAAHPARIAPKASLGQSHEGRTLWMWKISDNVLTDESEPEILIDAMHHAREPAGLMTLYWFVKSILEGYATDPGFAALIDQREIFVVPCVNPDGYVHNQTTNPAGGGLWRKNRRANVGGSFGVDLNRNYGYLWGYDNAGSSASPTSETYRGPSAFSEPETQAIVAFAQTRQITMAASLHTYGGVHLHPFGHIASAVSPMQAAYVEWGARMSILTGYRMGTSPAILYVNNGSSKDWWEGVHGIPSITSELGHENDGFWAPTARILPIAHDNMPSLLEWCWIGGSHVVIDAVALHQVAGNGNAWPEAGETFDVEVVLRNVGKATTSAAVSASAQAATPFSSLLIANAATPAALASRTNGSVTFRIAVATTLPRAAPLDLSVSWTFDGLTRTEKVSVVAGPVVTVLTDTFESAAGWVVGSPSDSGAGAWVRVDPDPTNLALISGGTTPWQSGDDHSSPGTQCWVTGNGGSASSPGSADLDGVTTLTSPAYDLGAVLDPTMRVWIWFANDDHDDTLQVSVSNDDGVSWITVESVLGWKNAWTQHVFRLADHLVPSNKTRFRFRAADSPSNSITEAAIDDFEIVGHQPALTIGALAAAQPVSFSLAGTPALAGAAYVVAVSTAASAGIATGDGRVVGVDASDLLGFVFTLPQFFQGFTGALTPAATASALLAVNEPSLAGFRFFATGVTYTPGPPLEVGELSGTLLITMP